MLAKAFFALTLFISPIAALTFQQKTEQIKFDAQWIDSSAQEIVDIQFIIDESGSVSRSEFDNAKQFVRSFLEYFSIAAQHGQASVITFGSDAEIRIRLKPDGSKCQFMTEFDGVTQRGGGTNAFRGFQLARQQFLANSRVSLINARPVVVFITDGGWNTGGDPRPEVDLLKQDNVLIIVITIGNIGQTYMDQMRSWSSQDYQNRPMTFDIESFTQIADLAKYLHRGLHKSIYHPAESSECQTPCGTDSNCYCDSLGRGTLQCGCDKGFYNKNNPHSCAACDHGFFQDEINVEPSCKSCPLKQTTLQSGSISSQSCLCATGYWNPNDNTEKPPCVDVTCKATSQYDMVKVHHVSVKGMCGYNYNTVCNYECLPGHVPRGPLSSKCNEKGLMHPATPVCDVLQCPVLTSVANAEGWQCNKGQSYQSACRNVCVKGYIPRPGTTMFIICSLDQIGTNGKWSGSPLICDPVKCGALPTIGNGQYDSPHCSDTSSDKVYGMKCEASCEHGYLIDQAASFVCQDDGQWTNEDVTPKCRDVTPPTIISCPSHDLINNDEAKSYAAKKILLPQAVDNSGEVPTTRTSVKTSGGEWVEVSVLDYNFPIGETEVRFNVTDRSGNSNAKCSYRVTVKDIEVPIVVDCHGPETDQEGFIYTSENDAYVTWAEPTFKDNSGLDLQIDSNTLPGRFRAGQTWSVKYTATDNDGNEASCEFSFKVSGLRCPDLDVPHNGAMTCDKLVFGVYCTPSCQRGLKFLVPDTLPYGRMPYDYFCTTEGNWRPHAIVAPCAVQTDPSDDEGFEFRWFDGDCNDADTKSQIIQNTIKALQDGITNSGFSFNLKYGKDGFNEGDFHVRCGAKNESIVILGSSRNKRAIQDLQDQPVKLHLLGDF